MPNKRHNKLKKAIYPAGFIFLVISISSKLGFSKYTMPAIDPISWESYFLQELPKDLFIALFFFVLFYIWQIIKKE